MTNFDDIDEEDKAGRKTRLFKRNETRGYIDTASLDAASLDKVTPAYLFAAYDRGFLALRTPSRKDKDIVYTSSTYSGTQGMALWRPHGFLRGVCTPGSLM